jgi:hypothetical protein
MSGVAENEITYTLLRGIGVTQAHGTTDASMDWQAPSLTDIVSAWFFLVAGRCSVPRLEKRNADHDN